MGTNALRVYCGVGLFCPEVVGAVCGRSLPPLREPNTATRRTTRTTSTLTTTIARYERVFIPRFVFVPGLLTVSRGSMLIGCRMRSVAEAAGPTGRTFLLLSGAGTSTATGLRMQAANAPHRHRIPVRKAAHPGDLEVAAAQETILQPGQAIGLGQQAELR